MQKVRVDDGRKEKTSFCIVDAQSVENTDAVEEKGYMMLLIKYQELKGI